MYADEAYEANTIKIFFAMCLHGTDIVFTHVYTTGGRESLGTARARTVLLVVVCVASADNQIGDGGATALAEALKKNTSLQALTLDSEYGGRGGEGRREGGGGRESFGTARARPACLVCV